MPESAARATARCSGVIAAKRARRWRIRSCCSGASVCQRSALRRSRCCCAAESAATARAPARACAARPASAPTTASAPAARRAAPVGCVLRRERESLATRAISSETTSAAARNRSQRDEARSATRASGRLLLEPCVEIEVLGKIEVVVARSARRCRRPAAARRACVAGGRPDAGRSRRANTAAAAPASAAPSSPAARTLAARLASAACRARLRRDSVAASRLSADSSSSAFARSSQAFVVVR